MTSNLPTFAAAAAEPRLRRLGYWLEAHRRAVVMLSLLGVVAMAAIGVATVGGLSLARFEAPGSESDRAAKELADQFGTGSVDLVLLVTTRGGSVDQPAVQHAGIALTNKLAGYPGVAEAASYWTRGNPATLRSDDHRQALVVARIPGSANVVRSEILPAIVPDLTRSDDLIEVRAGGGEEIFRQTVPQARQDFLRAELLIFPLAFLLLWLYSRRVLGAAVPLAIGVFAMIATLAILRLVLLFTDVSTFALNITLAMGLGLGIDYSLLIIARYREELRSGRPARDAVASAVEHAGRTVLFSAMTVGSSLAVLFALPFEFLRSFAYAGIAVVVGTTVGAIIVLPAILAMWGDRIVHAANGGNSVGGRWHSFALRVMRRPILYGGIAAAVIVLLASPALSLRFGVADDRILPESAPARQTQELIRQNFQSEETDALQVVATSPVVDLARYAQRLSELKGVAQVDSAAGAYVKGTPIGQSDTARFSSRQSEGTWISVVPTADQMERDPTGLVELVRATPAPFTVAVGGYPAELEDYRSSVAERLPILFSLILLVTFLLLFVMTGSLLIPLKAVVLNFASQAVMFGVLVWVYQQGHLSSILHFTSTGALDPSIPILMFCIAYGLSMDYEVFLLSRITEEYEKVRDTETAVAVGLQRSAPLITSAGIILALSFAAYASADIVFVQMIGVGMAVAILVDATLIRAVLVPVMMRLLGSANWYAPQTFRRVNSRWRVVH
ncbi:MMPL family transporter [Nocardia sp. NPDC001965]